MPSVVVVVDTGIVIKCKLPSLVPSLLPVIQVEK